ncbi:FlgD immunoglobulin-like domain containing protein [Streptomyces sp. NPDC048389]|uniref:FlgD immunoglobulin-like domain containing protein n=1 Tax=Streptomyces sp. NPDC048389 TaxID=3154622 RepID=UPI0034537E52
MSVTAAFALVAGLGPLAVPAVAAPTAETVAGQVDFTPSSRKLPRQEEIYNLGPTGYLHGSERHSSVSGDASVWTAYETGKSTELTGLGGGQGPGSGALGSAGEGSDVVAFDEVRSESVDLKDMATGTVTRVEVPSGDVNVGVFGSSVLVEGATGEDPDQAGWYLLRPQEDGSTVRTPIEGWPAGSDLGSARTLGGDARSVVASFSTTPDEHDEPDMLGVIDLATGELRSFEAKAATRVVLDPERIAWWDYRDRSVHIRDRAALDDAERTVAVPEDLDHEQVALLGGDWLMAPEKDGTSDPFGRGVVAFSMDGTQRKVLLENAVRQTEQFPGGGAVTIGGESSDAWFVHRATVENGTPLLRKLDHIEPMTAEVGAIAAAGGSVTTLEETGVRETSGFYRRDLAPLASPTTAGKAEWLGRETSRYETTSCGAVACESVFASGDGRAVYEVRTTVNGTTTAELVARGATDQVARVNTGQGSGQIVDTFGRYAAFASGAVSVGQPDATGKLVVVDFDAPAGSGIVLTKPRTAAAIWGSTLYTATGTAGEVELTDLRTGTKTGTLQTGASCVPVELQTAGRWLSWSCPYFRSSGAIDRDNGTKVTLPGERGLLGDGYFVTVPGTFAVTRFQDGTAETRGLGVRPGSNGGHATMRYSWTVDRFGGGIAYTDDEFQGHVIPGGVPASDLAALPTGVPAAADLAGGGGWAASWQLSRPASSWRLTVHDKAGTAVHSVVGGQTRGPVRVTWDGKDTAGKAVNGTYSWSLRAIPADGTGPAATATGTFEVTGGAEAVTGTFQPVQPNRVMDTRIGLGVPKAKIGAGQTVALRVAGTGGVPASGVTAVVMNVTATTVTATTYVAVHPNGTTRTSASNLNVRTGETRPNLVVVPVVNGKVNFYNYAGSLNLIADVSGYFTASGEGSTYEPVTPDRLMDTRTGLGVPKAKVGAGKTVTLQVTGRGGVPASGVTAVVLNVTGTTATATTYVAVHPNGLPRTSASNLNLVKGQTAPNLVVVPVVNGKVSFYNHAGTVNLIADVSGYFTSATDGSTYRPLTPTRFMDTRIGLGVPKAKVGAGKTVTLQVTGKNGVPASGVTAVVMNVTGTTVTATTYVAVYPNGTTRTSASNLNLVKGQTAPNLVVVPVVNGKVTFYNYAGSVNLIADVAGYYVS